jgi:ArsR family metal-binding transcriptional regulator
MPVNNEEKLEQINVIVENLATLGYRLDELLHGFALYNNNKSTLDIEVYEQISTMFDSAIDAMREQLDTYHRLFWQLKDIINL